MARLARRKYLAMSATAVGTVLFASADGLDQVSTDDPKTSTPDGSRSTGRAPTAAPCATDLERDEDGDVDFEFDGISFESDGRAVTFTADGDPFVDLEVEPGVLDLVIRTGEDRLELEAAGDSLEVEGTGSPVEFEKDGSDIDYHAPPIDVTWDGRDLDVDAPVSLEWETGAFEFRDDVTLTFDAEANDFEFECGATRRTRPCDE